MKTALVLITILAISPVYAEQVTIPDTRAGRVVAAWLEAFNSGDRARIGADQQESMQRRGGCWFAVAPVLYSKSVRFSFRVGLVRKNLA